MPEQQIKPPHWQFNLHLKSRRPAVLSDSDLVEILWNGGLAPSAPMRADSLDWENVQFMWRLYHNLQYPTERPGTAPPKPEYVEGPDAWPQATPPGWDKDGSVWDPLPDGSDEEDLVADLLKALEEVDRKIAQEWADRYIAAVKRSAGRSTSALPTEQTQPVAVKALEWRVFCSRSGNSEAKTQFGEYVIQSERDGWMLYLLNEQDSSSAYSTIDFAKAAAQSDYETRIRSALVDVPAEPVAWTSPGQLQAIERGSNGTVTKHGDEFMCIPLYNSPPLPREGEDTAEVERVCTEAAMQQWENSTKRPDLAEKDRVRGAIEAYKRQAFAFALAATRSGSATASRSLRMNENFKTRV